MSGDGAIVAYPLFQKEDGGSLPTSPLQLIIYEIPVSRAKELNIKWHSRLPAITNPYSGHTVCYGAMFDSKYYACAIWTDPIARAFNHQKYLELRRMAICNTAPKNTASRMLRIMATMIKRKWPQIVKLISYQDTEVHKGTIYKASGWYVGNITKAKDVRWGIQNKQGTARKRNFIIASGDKIRWEKEIKNNKR